MKKTKVVIDDMSFYVVGNDNPEYVKTLARELDEKIKEVKGNNFRLNPTQALILASLNILDSSNRENDIEIRAKNLSKDQEAVKKQLEELERLKKELELSKKSTSVLEKQLKKSNEELLGQKEENKSLSQNMNLKNSEINDLKEEIRKLENEKNKLSDKIYENQKEIIDLSRQIEILSNEN